MSNQYSDVEAVLKEIVDEWRNAFSCYFSTTNSFRANLFETFRVCNYGRVWKKVTPRLICLLDSIERNSQEHLQRFWKLKRKTPFRCLGSVIELCA
jgi:hypothetical protein